MKISTRWLKEWVPFELAPRVLGERLTMAGFELESVASAAPAFTGVVVGEILAAEKHPQADKLRVCQVSVGSGEAPLQIVCGAANARVGLRAPLARVGAQLPGDLSIRAAKLRGVESAGMLCSAKELGLAEASEGLLELPNDAPVGESLRTYLDLDDEVLELAVTPNRGDALSVRGIAREVGALLRLAVKEPDVTPVAPTIVLSHQVKIEHPAGCARFHARIVAEVDNTRPTPLWLRERLRRAGQRSISPVVDVTNYLVLEMGQPMHAYDLDRLEGSLCVRLAQAGETCELLDGRTVTLEPDMLVIADAKGPVALAGVMGGTRTAVSASTRRVLFEVAWFAPSAIAGRGRRFGLVTDASQRFERGVDPEVGQRVIERATELLRSITGGEAGPVCTCEAGSVPARPMLTLRLAQLKRVLGGEWDRARAREVLELLGLGVKDQGERFEVSVPAHRFDLSIERDLIEEIARVVGFEAIPTETARVAQTIRPSSTREIPEQRWLDVLSARGYHEAVHFAFVDPELQERLFPGVGAHRLSNPIASDLAVMRVSLWPGLIKAALDNQRRQQTRVRLIEHGVVFPAGAGERDQLAGIALGSRWPEQWGGGAEPLDGYDLRADLEALLSLAEDRAAWRFEAAELPCLHPGRSARILRHGEPVGWVGELHPAHVRALGFTQAPVLFELETERALAVRYAPFVEVSRFPQVRRDLAVVVDEAISYAEVRERVLASASSLLRDIVLFDVYRGKGIESGRKSLALGLILQDKDRTLTDDDTDRVLSAVREALVRQCQATFRE